MKLVNVALSLCLSTFAVACDDGSSGEPSQQEPGAGGGKTDDAEGPTNIEMGCTYIEVDFEACTNAGGSDGSCKARIYEDYADVDACCEVDDFGFCGVTNLELACSYTQDEYQECLGASPAGSDCEHYVNEALADAPKCCVLGDYGFCDIAGGQFCQEVDALLDQCYRETTEGCQDWQQLEYPLYDVCGFIEPDDTCGDIAEDLAECEQYGDEGVDCQAYLRDEYPQGGDCCPDDAYPEVCAAFG